MAHAGNEYLIQDAGGLKVSDMVWIEKDEAVYLRKIPIEKRVKSHDLGIFSKVRALTPGSQCLYKTEKCTVLFKDVKADGIKFGLRSRVWSF